MIISIANQKGGVGKTTTAMNLGVALRLMGNEVLLIDFDPQANLSTYLGFENKTKNILTVSDLIMSAIGQSDKSRDITDYIRTSAVNDIDYIPSDINLANAEYYLNVALSRETVLRRILSEDIISEYDYIIIDCNPSLGILLMNALTASNGIIIPVQAQDFALAGLNMLNNIFEQVRTTLKPDLQLIGVLATIVEESTKASKRVIAKLKKCYADKLFDTYIHKATEAVQSTDKHKSLCLYKNRLGDEYKALAYEVFERCG